MSITAYTGLPGSGKSYGVMKNVLAPALKKSGQLISEGKPGIQVCTNIPTNKEACMERFGCVVDEIDILEVLEPEFSWDERLEGGSLLVLDEIWRLWPAGMQASKAREIDKELLAMHRHKVGENGRSMEIVLVTQDLGQISAFARQLVEYTYHARKLDNVGMPDRFNVNVYQGAVTGSAPPDSKKIKSIKAEKYDPQYFELYSSHTQGDGTAGTEEKMDKRNNALTGAFAKVILVVLAVGIAGVLYVFNGIFDSDAEAASTALETPPLQAESLQVQSSMQGIAIEPKNQSDFLDNIDTIYIEIANKKGSFYSYEFRARTNDQGETTLNTKNLKRLGVRVDSIDRCLSRLVTNNSERLVFCRANEIDRSIFTTSE